MNAFRTFRLLYIPEDQLLVFSSDKGALYSLPFKEITDDITQEHITNGVSLFQDNSHLASIQLLLTISKTQILSLGFDRMVAGFELQMNGRFTESMFKFHTLGQTVTTMLHGASS